MQVAQYVISGLTQALDNCSQASAAPYGVATVGAMTRTNVNKAAVMVSHLSSPHPQCTASNSRQLPVAWAICSSAAAPARLLFPWAVPLSHRRLGNSQPAPVPYSSLRSQDGALFQAMCACSPYTGGVRLPAALAQQLPTQSVACRCVAEGNSSLKPVLTAPLLADVSEGRPAMPPVQVFAEGMGRLLEAISVTSSIIKALQQHFAKVVAPHMEDAPAEGATCASGLAALVHAVEDRVLACLQGGLNALFGQVSRLDTGFSGCCMLSDRLVGPPDPAHSTLAPLGGLEDEMAARGDAAAHADQLLNAAAG